SPPSRSCVARVTVPAASDHWALITSHLATAHCFSFCHFCDVHFEACLRQQRRECERLKAVSGNFSVTVNSRLAFNHLLASFQIGEEGLCLARPYLNFLSASDHRFGCVGTDQLRPVFFQ